jgi:hypothetical protein
LQDARDAGKPIRNNGGGTCRPVRSGHFDAHPFDISRSGREFRYRNYQLKAFSP